MPLWAFNRGAAIQGALGSAKILGVRRVLPQRQSMDGALVDGQATKRPNEKTDLEVILPLFFGHLDK